MTCTREQAGSLDKEYTRLERQYRKLERDYRALAIMHEQSQRLNEANNAARETANFYNNLLLKNTPGIIFMLDEQLRFVQGSETVLQLIDYKDKRELVNRPFADLFSRTMPDDWIADILQRCQNIMQTDKPDRHEEHLTLKNGRNIALQTTIAPASDDNTQKGVVVVLNDVTLLMREREAAQRANEAKSVFLSNMSHEIRTPLNAIFGMTTIAKKSPDAKGKDYCLEKIENASTHLLGVINDILDISKIEANKFTLSPVECNIEKVLQKSVNAIQFRVEEKKQVLTVHIDSGLPPTVLCDDQHLAQVVMNLLTNAVKFTPEQGSLHLDARLEKREGDKCLIRVTVRDTGIGLSEEQQARLFMPFEQADNSTTRKFGGTGLGLAISKRIVEMMNGRIWVTSEEGKGATFTFVIQAQALARREAPLLPPHVTRENLRVLVVDDMPELLEYFAEIMSHLDISCDTAGSGEEALEMVERNGHYDIYFVDWKMPGMNGIELSRKLKRHSNESIIIMISAAEWESIEQEAKEAGVDKFLSKPLFPSSVTAYIHDFFDAGQQAEEQAAPAVQPRETFEGYRIILADDVDINREIVLALLEPTLLTVDCAENGLEAVNLFSANQDSYALILMDVQMPEMDGLEATRRIRALGTEAGRTVPIIAMTAHVFREDIETCLAAGMSNHLSKPLNFEDVLAKLRQYLKPRQKAK
jgi:PAS domain S-box-containing protein